MAAEAAATPSASKSPSLYDFMEHLPGVRRPAGGPFSIGYTRNSRRTRQCLAWEIRLRAGYGALHACLLDNQGASGANCQHFVSSKLLRQLIRKMDLRTAIASTVVRDNSLCPRPRL